MAESKDDETDYQLIYKITLLIGIVQTAVSLLFIIIWSINKFDNKKEFKYQNAKNLEERKQEYDKVIKSNPGKIAIICEKAPNSHIVDIEKSKFLIAEDISLSQFSVMIRKKLKMGKEEALFFLVNGKKSLTGDGSMLEIYNTYKNEDGFLYIAYAAEEVWGK